MVIIYREERNDCLPSKFQNIIQVGGKVTLSLTLFFTHVLFKTTTLYNVKFKNLKILLIQGYLNLVTFTNRTITVIYKIKKSSRIIWITKWQINLFYQGSGDTKFWYSKRGKEQNCISIRDHYFFFMSQYRVVMYTVNFVTT